MGDTPIQWTDKTWNPVRGCSRVSEGCRNCYAERTAARFAGLGPGPDGDYHPKGTEPFHGFVHIVNGHPAWTRKVELVEKHLTDPLKWRKPAKIFVNSMSDLFHEALSFAQISRVVWVIRVSPWHTYQALTKRAERLKAFAEWWYVQTTEPLPQNLWVGVSVEDQVTANQRIPLLLQTPAVKRFVSYEPALGPVDFDEFIYPTCETCGDTAGPRDAKECSSHGTILPPLDWIIVGGESGPGARLFDIAWARNAIQQCRAAGVACFVKQLGNHPQEIARPLDVTDSEAARWQGDGWTRIFDQDGEHWRKYFRLKDGKGGDMSEWPKDLRVREFPA